MITVLSGPTGERIFDGEVGRFVETSLIPCHRCGVCCERWQPLVSPAEVERLAAHLSLTHAELADRFTTPYPFDDATCLLRRTERGCVFLDRDDAGRALCTVHPARPDACRDWLASLSRRECVGGLARFGCEDRPLLLMVLYPDDEERQAFMQTIRSDAGVNDDA